MLPTSGMMLPQEFLPYVLQQLTKMKYCKHYLLTAMGIFLFSGQRNAADCLPQYLKASEEFLLCWDTDVVQVYESH